MDILILGLLLWSLPHLLKRIAPGLRGRLGDVPGKMHVTVLSLAAIALMMPPRSIRRRLSSLRIAVLRRSGGEEYRERSLLAHIALRGKHHA